VTSSNALTPDVLDKFAADYYLNPNIADVDIEELAQSYSVPLILDAVNGCRNVLEMGFGTGLISGALLEAGVHLEVVEGSARLCVEARDRHPDLRVHQSMFETFAPPSEYDAVLALHVFEHVDDAVSLARHVLGWLRPGGVLVAVTPNANSLHRRLGVRMGLQRRREDLSARDHLVGHRRVYTLRELARDLTHAGLQCEKEFGYFVKPLANSQLLGLDHAVLVGLNELGPEVPADLCANIGIVARRP
jgi:2-polyprenyl-3-methyl-5-hydroxy-6-metoxy-1,4-benzoquinol methylase